MDVIASLGFGMEIDSQTNPKNSFVKYAKELVAVDFNPLIVLAGTCGFSSFTLNELIILYTSLE